MPVNEGSKGSGSEGVRMIFWICGVWVGLVVDVFVGWDGAEKRRNSNSCPSSSSCSASGFRCEFASVSWDEDWSRLVSAFAASSSSSSGWLLVDLFFFLERAFGSEREVGRDGGLEGVGRRESP